MGRIYKYELLDPNKTQGWCKDDDEAIVVEVDMPFGARVLSVAVQRGVVCAWALVDPDSGAPRIAKRFRLYGGTGVVAHPGVASFVGTALLMGGDLVLHVFVEP